VRIIAAKTLVFCLAGLVLLATVDPAQARKPKKIVPPRVGCAADPNNVCVGDRKIGYDPDPFIRSQILRHWSLGYPD
jgi:hypothetical protein